MNPLPPPALWFLDDRAWYRRWEVWLVAAGLFGVGLFVGTRRSR